MSGSRPVRCSVGPVNKESCRRKSGGALGNASGAGSGGCLVVCGARQGAVGGPGISKPISRLEPTSDQHESTHARLGWAYGAPTFNLD
jgi:hypothetical protein